MISVGLIYEKNFFRATATTRDHGNTFHETDNKNRLIQCKDVVVWFIDTTTLLGRANQRITIEHKDRLKASLIEDYRKYVTKTIQTINF